MINEIYLVLGQLSVLAIFGVIGGVIFRRTFDVKWLLAALALYFVYDVFLTRLLFLIPHWPIEANWNWMGKIMAVFFTLAIAFYTLFGFANSGLTLKQNKNSRSAWITFLILTITVFYFAITSGDGADDLETIAFQ